MLMYMKDNVFMGKTFYLTKMLNLRYINNLCFNVPKRIFLYQCAFIAVWENYCSNYLIINIGCFLSVAGYIPFLGKPGSSRDETRVLS